MTAVQRDFEVTFPAGRLGFVLEPARERTAVTSVLAGGVADRGRVRPGDVVVSVNGTDVREDGYNATLAAIEASARPITIGFARGSRSRQRCADQQRELQTEKAHADGAAAASSTATAATALLLRPASPRSRPRRAVSSDGVPTPSLNPIDATASFYGTVPLRVALPPPLPLLPSLNPALTPRSAYRLLHPAALPDGREGAGAGAGAQHGAKAKMTTWQAGFNVVNLYIGLGILSQPYALARGGMLSLAVLWGLGALSLFTGRLIVRCFTRMEALRSPHAGAPATFPTFPTYPELGQAACGRFGRVAVVVLIFVEYFGGTCMLLLFLWKNALLLLPPAPAGGGAAPWQLWHVAAAVFGACLPTVWMLRFADLSWLGALGFTASGVIAAVLVGALAESRGALRGDGVNYGIDTAGLQTSTGIFMLALAGHACLPSIYSQMERPQDFGPMLGVSFALVLGVYSVVAAAGYLLFGETVQVLVTGNIAAWPGGWVSRLLLAFVVAKCFCSIAPIVTVLAELPENALGLHGDGELGRGTRQANSAGGGAAAAAAAAASASAPSSASASAPSSASAAAAAAAAAAADDDDGRARTGLAIRAIRTALLLLCSLVAYWCRDRLGVVEALVGGLASMSNSVIFPCVFYLRLPRAAGDGDEGGGGGCAARAALYVISALGIAAAVCLTVQNVRAFMA